MSGVTGAPPGSGARRIVLAAIGLLWGQGALAIAVILLPQLLVYGEAVKRGLAYRLVMRTALLPWFAASEGVARASAGTEHLRAAALDTSFAVAVLTPLVACVLVAVASKCARVVWWWQASVVIVMVAIAASVTLAVQLGDSLRAEREFFALVSSTETPHRSPAVIAGAKSFLARHPYSRWRAEALRIDAMAAEESGDDLAAERGWERFGGSFSDVTVPGVAYAEYSRARCWERLGWPERAARHYRLAVSVIRARSDGIQGWIGSDGATALARLERVEGRPLRAVFWTERASGVPASSWN